MIRTGQDYLESIRDGRAVYLEGERVADVAAHPVFRPLVDLRARIFDMAHDPATSAVMTTMRDGRPQPVANALPYTQADWWAKRRATDAILDASGGVVTRIGDETLGEIWSLQDAAEALDAIDPQFTPNIRAHIDRVLWQDPFHISANAEPKAPGGLPHDMALTVVRETDAGVILRGAKFETAAAYANQAYTKPAIADWGGAEQSPHVLGFICDLGAPGLRLICRPGLAGQAAAADYPLTSRLDEIDTLVIFDDVLVPWENVLFYRHTQAAMQVRATQHRYTAFAFLQRHLRMADLMIGTALHAVRQAGLEGLQAVQEKLADLACWRESLNAHLTAAITLAERAPSGLMMPNQSLLYAGRALACGQLHHMMQIARELCGGQIALLPGSAAFAAPDTAPWLDRIFGAGDSAMAEDRRRLLAFARDLLNSAHAGHRLTFQLFAQSPPFAHLAAVYHNFDWDGPLSLVQSAAGLCDRAGADDGLPQATQPQATQGVSKWFATAAPRGRAALQ